MNYLTDKQVVRQALRRWANHIETGDPEKSSTSSVLTNAKQPDDFVIRLRAIAKQINV